MGEQMRRNAFTIPGQPSVLVSVSETPTGALLFELTVLGPLVADLRGLFFDVADPTLLASLSVEGDDVTTSRAGSVSDLGSGVNMNGSGPAFDFGIAFGTPGISADDIRSTSFVLSSDAGPLTMDFIANVDFGARLTSIGADGGARGGSSKIRTVSTAAPDAIDDAAETDEDTPFTIDVLANDTDADADALTITAILDAPDNGTVAIVDNRLVYTPNANFSGVDSIVYEISDGRGGFDHATLDLTIVAVADAPDLTVTVRKAVPDQPVNLVIVDIAAAVTDTDGSESIKELVIRNVPAGVVVAGAVFSAAAGGYVIAAPGPLETIELTLPEGQSLDFELEVTATSVEASNGDEADTVAGADIDFDFNRTSVERAFEATDRSIWSDDALFTFEDNRFLGIDYEDSFLAGDTSTGAGGSLDLRAGLQSDLLISGGGVDAEAPFRLDFDTSFNRASDVLRVDTGGALLPGGGFATTGPFATYQLDFVFELDWNLFINVLGTSVLNIDPGPIDAGFNIIDYDSRTSPPLSVEVTTGITVDFQWPTLDTVGTEGELGAYSSSGASNNALQLNVNVLDVAFSFLRIPNPLENTIDFFDDVTQTGFELTWELLGIDLFAGLNFLQDFTIEVDPASVAGVLTDETGGAHDFILGDMLTFYDASDLDADADGDVAFDVDLALEDVVMSNLTSLGFNAGATLTVLDIFGQAGFLGITDDFRFGPVFEETYSFDIASIPVFDTTFNLQFQEENLTLLA
jgi:hypothetical protein